ncbi:Zn-ribbon domain-containing OB-fold protein [Candidatus Poriferisocius sp.]|uniref:Zn-ribbon domain-containing OB-fold protein n=1 Tax=Candidatus Poriferisocius sp. TaxID=3101276 RepID=UPI003B017B88
MNGSGAGYFKPLPTVTTEDREFWAEARRHRFVLPRCRNCGHVWFPPYASCPRCLSFDREWTRASGRGTVWGFTLMRQPYIPSFEPELPYNVVLVELEEGPMMYSNLIGIDNAAITCGLEVEAAFEDITPEITLIKFRPAERGTTSTEL